MWRYLFYFLSKASQKKIWYYLCQKEKKIPHKNIKVHIINEKKWNIKLKREWERTQNKGTEVVLSQDNLYFLKTLYHIKCYRIKKFAVTIFSVKSSLQLRMSRYASFPVIEAWESLISLTWCILVASISHSTRPKPLMVVLGATGKWGWYCVEK